MKKIKAVGTQQISYQGTIALAVRHGNRTLYTREYHNSGLPNLFKFLALALAGNASLATRPVKIRLYNYAPAEEDPESTAYVSPNNFKWSNSFVGNVKPDPASPFIQYDTTPVIKKVADVENPTDDDYHYETIFHFRIPFSYISMNRIHLIALFPNNATDDQLDASAYYKLVDDEDTNTWKPMVFDDVAGNYSIIIEWTLSLANKTITQSAPETSVSEDNSDEQDSENESVNG